MFTIHGYKSGYYCQLVFLLLPSKSTETNHNMWRFISTICEKEIHTPLSINSIIMDFEMAAHRAINNFFPNCQVKGCHFHLKQSWFRKIKSNSLLLKEYKNKNSEIGNWLKKFFGLSFLPHQEIGEAFTELYENAPESEEAIIFADYIVENYIDENEASFKPNIWASKPSDVPKTTNGCEAFHKHFNAQFYHIKPTIFTFIDILKGIQCETYLKIASSEKRKAYQRKSEKDKQEWINKIWIQYQTGEIDRIRYVEILGHKFSVHN